MIELIPLFLVAVICFVLILLGYFILNPAAGLASKSKPKPRPVPPEPKPQPVIQGSGSNDFATASAIIGLSALMRLLTIPFFTANPVAQLLLFLLILCLLWSLFNPQSSKPPKHQRVPITHSKRNDWDNRDLNHQRVPIAHPKRNDWDNRRFDKPLPPLKKSDWKPSRRNRVLWFKRVADTISSGPSQRVNPKQQELLSLLNGDRDAAQRLLSHAKSTNPGESETWYFEKVISDIIRDRR